MMRTLSPLLIAALTKVVASNPPPPTPVAKVIQLLEDLKSKVTTEGQAEAASYEKFACFCKEMNNQKGGAITAGRDTINTKSSEIESKTATKEEKEEELRTLSEDNDSYRKQRTELIARHERETAVFQDKQADFQNALRSLNNAMASMEASKPAFLAIRENSRKGNALSGVMKLIPEARQKEVRSLLQTTAAVDPSDPEFKYHSQGIIDVLTKLHADFTQWKTDLETEWGKTVQTFEGARDALDRQISSTQLQIDELKGTTIPTLTSEIAAARIEVVNNQAMLKDDQRYLKDLTSLCETRAQQWDQRSALRHDELQNLQQALTVLENDVRGRDAAVNERAVARVTLVQNAHSAVAKQARPVSLHHVAPSFLQEASSSATKTMKLEAYLRGEGQRLHSSLLTAVASQVGPNPFKKVKDLIQRLIERLIAESQAEATKKGFCDQNLAEARQDRDYRLADIKDLNQELQQLELKQDQLQSDTALLNDTLVNLNAELSTATANREAEHNVNTHTIKEAKLGLDGVQRAIVILKVFYKNAAKETVLSQISPVDEDLATQDARAGFTGAYTGAQDSSKGVIGLLQVIEADFDRTIRTTEEAEAKAHAEFVLFERDAKADISGKEEKVALNMEDLTTTLNTIEEKMQALQKAQELLDSALKQLEVLKPTCIDTTMKFADRVAKREEEMQALRRALCILDTENVEADCPVV